MNLSPFAAFPIDGGPFPPRGLPRLSGALAHRLGGRPDPERAVATAARAGALPCVSVRRLTGRPDPSQATAEVF